MPRRIRTMHLDKPLDGELFMKREGVDPDKTPDDEPEWLDNDRDLANEKGSRSEQEEPDDEDLDDDDPDDEDGPDYETDEED